MIERRDGLRVHSLLFVSSPEVLIGTSKARVHLENPQRMFNGLCVMTGKAENGGEVCPGRQGNGIKRLGPSRLRNGFVPLAHCNQIIGVVKVGIRIVWV